MRIIGRIHHVRFLRAISGIIIVFIIAVIQVGVHLTIGGWVAPVAHFVGALIYLELVLNLVVYLLCRQHLLHFLLDHLAFQKSCWRVLQ